MTIDAALRRQLAADLACEPDMLERDGIHVVESAKRPGRRRFPWRERRLTLTTMGSGTVASVSAERIDWAHEHLGALDRDQCFNGPTLALLQHFLEGEGQRLEGPVLKFTCATERLAPPHEVAGVALTLHVGDELDPLYTLHALDVGHALGKQRRSERPDVLATTARAGDRIVGIAGASADSDELWQIGVGVEPAWRERGVARELVGELTRAILERERVPYYSTYPSNLASINLARSVGYWLAWVEIDARDAPAAEQS